jgi:glycosyltransferase involved in cell wall biosynthesis
MDSMIQSIKDGNNIPLVTIGIITYQNGAFIEDCIKSLVTQTYSSLEIIISDDGSTDNSREIIQKYADENKSIIPIMSSVNRGIANNMNVILDSARGKYICIMAGDDIMLPEKIEKQVQILEENPDYEACAHNVDVFDSDTNQTLYYWLDKFLPTRNVQDALFNTNWFFRKNERKTPSASWLARADYFKAGRNDTRTSSMHEFLQGIGFLKYKPDAKWYTIPEVLGRYRMHQSALSKKNYRWQVMAEEVGIACNIAKIRCPEYYGSIHNYEAFWWFKNYLHNWIPSEYRRSYRGHFIKNFGIVRYGYLLICTMLLSKQLIGVRQLLKLKKTRLA